jgi:uncharacterized DUF497 family protein
MEFEWDERKAEYNLQTHGIPFSEAATVFYDPLSITLMIPTIQTMKRGSSSLGHQRSNGY